MKHIFFGYMITILVLGACSSGKSTFERGNYYEAVITSVNRLRRNSDHKKSIENLRQAYPFAVTFYVDRANTSLASTNAFKWSAVVDSYTAINIMYDEIKRCPGALKVIPEPVNYFSQLQEAKANAAEENYAAGIAALQLDNREKAKEAYTFFKTALRFVPDYKDATKMMDEALWAATIKVMVEPIPVHSKNVGVSAEFFNDKISEYVHSAPINEFVRFFTRQEIEKIRLKPDHIIQLEFDDFTVGQVYRHEKESQLSKDSVEVGSYVSTLSTNQQNEYAKGTNPVGGSGLVDSPGNGAVVTTPTQNNAVTAEEKALADKLKADKELADKLKADKELADKLKADKEKADKEIADKLKADKELADKHKADKEKADKELADKHKADKEKADKELADKLKADKEKADKELADKHKADKEKADKEIADKLKADKEKVDKEIADKLKADKEKADQEIADKLKADKEKADKEIADKLKTDKEKVDKEIADKLKADKEKADKEIADKLKADKEKADKEIADKLKADKEKADKEVADKLKADKEKADKEVADKLKADKEKTDKEKYTDPTIDPADTTDVKDPVTICHMPPGNPSNNRTLTISRSALKAHLGHGDVEGSCETDKKGPKDKPQENNKNEKAPAEKGSEKKKDGKALLYDKEQTFIASADNDIHKYLRYFSSTLPAELDTNKVYATVKATLYEYQKKITSKGIVSFKIIDAKTGALLSVEKMPGEFVWVSEWATFNGDERALSAQQLRLTQQKEQAPPDPQDLFIEFTKPIFNQLTSKIQDFYKGY